MRISDWSSDVCSSDLKLTLLPLLVRAVVVALREFPHINARYDDEAQIVTHYGAVHMGIAAQTDAGLMVPVLRHAEALDLRSEEHTSELQSLMRLSYAVFCLKKKKKIPPRNKYKTTLNKAKS